MKIKKLHRFAERADETTKQKFTRYLYYIYRGDAVLMFATLFMSSLNPAMISGMIPRSTSMLTAAFSWEQLTGNMGRAFRRGWVFESTMRLVMVSCIICLIGYGLCIAAMCLSPGNAKCRRLGKIFSGLGSIVSMVSMAGIFTAYTQISQTTRAAKVQPMFPQSAVICTFVLCGLMLVMSIILMLTDEKPAKDEKYAMDVKYRLFLMMLPFIVLTFIFCYLPLWGWRYAFFDYKAGDTLSMKNFAGLKWFKIMFANKQTRSDIIRVMRNTLAMSGLGLALSWLPMVFAIFLNEIKHSRFRKFVQTFTTIPNFISWVLVFAIAFAIFSTDGFVSSMMVNAGFWEKGKNFLMDPSHTWLKMWAWGTWKGLGWSAIIYIAGISGIDQDQYEAATVDGAGRFAKMWYVTIPGLLPTFFVLFLMAVAGILSNGLDQYLVFENSNNTSWMTVLDLYVYKMGIVGQSIPLSTAIGMLKSIISVILLMSANKVSKVIRGESII